MIEIIDNFLPEEEFMSIQSLLMSHEFFWYYAVGCVSHDDGQYHMAHVFYQPKIGVNSEYYRIWKPMMEKIKVSSMERIKANMTFQTSKPVPSGYHSDDLGSKTGILYINTNNGCTEFENGVRVKSVANRYLSFDTPLNHRAISCTDELRRIVVNFNYA